MWNRNNAIVIEMWGRIKLSWMLINQCEVEIILKWWV